MLFLTLKPFGCVKFVREVVCMHGQHLLKLQVMLRLFSSSIVELEPPLGVVVPMQQQHALRMSILIFRMASLWLNAITSTGIYSEELSQKPGLVKSKLKKI